MSEQIESIDIVQSLTLGELAKALAKAQTELDHAKKESTNPHFRSKYADLAAVLDASRPLAKNGIATVQIPVERDNGRIALHSRLIHSSGEFIGGTFSVKPTKDDPQGAGSALTYLRRYAAQALSGMASDDDDGNAASARPERTQEASSETKTATRTPSKSSRGELMTLATKTLGPQGCQKWLKDQGFQNIKDVAEDALPGLMSDLKELQEKITATP